MTSQFRAPTSEMPEWVTPHTAEILSIRDGDDRVDLLVSEAEFLLEVLLDICPNAKALAHNWLLEEQKREYMAGGK